MGLIRKAIVPVAGLGTRLLPMTSVLPKALFPLVHPDGRIGSVLQLILEQVVAGGIDEVAVVVSPGQAQMLERYLAVAASIAGLTLPSHITFVEQMSPRGFGDAVLCGMGFVGTEPFLVLLGDHIQIANEGAKPCVLQVLEAFALCGFDLGGAERQALYFARYLKNLGCDVKVWGHHHQYRGPERVIDHCEAAGIPWAEYKFRWPCGKRALVRDGFRMLRGLYCERPDVILSYTTWPNVGCGLVWRLSPAKVCIWGQRDIRLHGDAVERFAYRRSSAIICNAAHEADYLRRTLGKTSAPVYVIHNGIDMVPCQKTRAQWRAELGIGVETMVATMVANFRLGKDHVSLLYAWRRLLRMSLKGQSLPRLLLAGAHQESYESVHNLARDLDLLDSVVFPGQVQDVAGLLAASDIGVLATADEGLPNAVLEYMASGLPVMVTDIPGNREALGDEADDQLCHTGDVESLAQKLLALIQSPDLRSRLGQRNRQRALAEFSITKMCETMAGTVCDLLRAVPARA